MMTDEQRKELYNKVYNYTTKHPAGFTQPELDELLKDYPEINMDKFNDALNGNTCQYSEDDGLIQYHCDIYTAIICGLENRTISIGEWD